MAGFAFFKEGEKYKDVQAIIQRNLTITNDGGWKVSGGKIKEGETINLDDFYSDNNYFLNCYDSLSDGLFISYTGNIFGSSFNDKFKITGENIDNNSGWNAVLKDNGISWNSVFDNEGKIKKDFEAVYETVRGSDIKIKEGASGIVVYGDNIDDISVKNLVYEDGKVINTDKLTTVIALADSGYAVKNGENSNVCIELGNNKQQVSIDKIDKNVLNAAINLADQDFTVTVEDKVSFEYNGKTLTAEEAAALVIEHGITLTQANFDEAKKTPNEWKEIEDGNNETVGYVMFNNTTNQYETYSLVYDSDKGKYKAAYSVYDSENKLLTSYYSFAENKSKRPTKDTTKDKKSGTQKNFSSLFEDNKSSSFKCGNMSISKDYQVLDGEGTISITSTVKTGYVQDKKTKEYKAQYNVSMNISNVENGKITNITDSFNLTATMNSNTPFAITSLKSNKNNGVLSNATLEGTVTTANGIFSVSGQEAYISRDSVMEYINIALKDDEGNITYGYSWQSQNYNKAVMDDLTETYKDTYGSCIQMPEKTLTAKLNGTDLSSVFIFKTGSWSIGGFGEDYVSGNVTAINSSGKVEFYTDDKGNYNNTRIYVKDGTLRYEVGSDENNRDAIYEVTYNEDGTVTTNSFSVIGDNIEEKVEGTRALDGSITTTRMKAYFEGKLNLPSQLTIIEGDKTFINAEGKKNITQITSGIINCVYDDKGNVVEQEYNNYTEVTTDDKGEKLKTVINGTIKTEYLNDTNADNEEGYTATKKETNNLTTTVYNSNGEFVSSSKIENTVTHYTNSKNPSLSKQVYSQSKTTEYDEKGKVKQVTVEAAYTSTTKGLSSPVIIENGAVRAILSSITTETAHSVTISDADGKIVEHFSGYSKTTTSYTSGYSNFKEYNNGELINDTIKPDELKVKRVTVDIAVKSLVENTQITKDFLSVGKSLQQAQVKLIIQAAVVAVVAVGIFFSGGTLLGALFMVADVYFAATAAGDFYDKVNDYNAGYANTADVAWSGAMLAITMLPSIGNISKTAAAAAKAGEDGLSVWRTENLIGRIRSGEISFFREGRAGMDSLRRVRDNYKGATEGSRLERASKSLLKGAHQETNTGKEGYKAFFSYYLKDSGLYKMIKGVRGETEIGIAESIVKEAKNFTGLSHFKNASPAIAFGKLIAQHTLGIANSTMGLLRFQAIGGTIAKHIAKPINDKIKDLLGDNNIFSTFIGFIIMGLGGGESDMFDMKAEDIRSSFDMGLKFYVFFGITNIFIGGLASRGEAVLELEEKEAKALENGAKAKERPQSSVRELEKHSRTAALFGLGDSLSGSGDERSGTIKLWGWDTGISKEIKIGNWNTGLTWTGILVPLVLTFMGRSKFTRPEQKPLSEAIYDLNKADKKSGQITSELLEGVNKSLEKHYPDSKVRLVEGKQKGSVDIEIDGEVVYSHKHGKGGKNIGDAVVKALAVSKNKGFLENFEGKDFEEFVNKDYGLDTSKINGIEKAMVVLETSLTEAVKSDKGFKVPSEERVNVLADAYDSLFGKGFWNSGELGSLALDINKKLEIMDKVSEYGKFKDGKFIEFDVDKLVKKGNEADVAAVLKLLPPPNKSSNRALNFVIKKFPKFSELIRRDISFKEVMSAPKMAKLFKTDEIVEKVKDVYKEQGYVKDGSFDTEKFADDLQKDYETNKNKLSGIFSLSLASKDLSDFFNHESILDNINSRETIIKDSMLKETVNAKFKEIIVKEYNLDTAGTKSVLSEGQIDSMIDSITENLTPQELSSIRKRAVNEVAKEKGIKDIENKDIEEIEKELKDKIYNDYVEDYIIDELRNRSQKENPNLSMTDLAKMKEKLSLEERKHLEEKAKEKYISENNENLELKDKLENLFEIAKVMENLALSTENKALEYKAKLIISGYIILLKESFTFEDYCLGRKIDINEQAKIEYVMDLLKVYEYNKEVAVEKILSVEGFDEILGKVEGNIRNVDIKDIEKLSGILKQAENKITDKTQKQKIKELQAAVDKTIEDKYYRQNKKESKSKIEKEEDRQRYENSSDMNKIWNNIPKIEELFPEKESINDITEKELEDERIKLNENENENKEEIEIIDALLKIKDIKIDETISLTELNELNEKLNKKKMELKNDKDNKKLKKEKEDLEKEIADIKFKLTVKKITESKLDELTKLEFYKEYEPIFDRNKNLTLSEMIGKSITGEEFPSDDALKQIDEEIEGYEENKNYEGLATYLEGIFIGNGLVKIEGKIYILKGSYDFFAGADTGIDAWNNIKQAKEELSVEYEKEVQEEEEKEKRNKDEKTNVDEEKIKKDVLNKMSKNLLGAKLYLNGVRGNLEYADYLIAQKISLYKIYSKAEVSAEYYRYIDKLGTAGGKTVITGITTGILLDQASEGKVVTIFTNTPTNANELVQEVKQDLGLKDNEVVHLKGSENKDNAADIATDKNIKIVVTDYNTYNGVIAREFSEIFTAENNKKLLKEFESIGIDIKEIGGQLKCVNPHHANIVLKLLRGEKVSRAQCERDNVNLNYKDIEQKAEKFKINIKEDSILNRIENSICDEVDTFATIAQQSLAEANGCYITTTSMVRYYERIQQIKEKIEENNGKENSDIRNEITSLQSEFSALGEKKIEKDLKTTSVKEIEKRKQQYADGSVPEKEVKDIMLKEKSEKYEQYWKALATRTFTVNIGGEKYDVTLKDLNDAKNIDKQERIDEVENIKLDENNLLSERDNAIDRNSVEDRKELESTLKESCEGESKIGQDYYESETKNIEAREKDNNEKLDNEKLRKIKENYGKITKEIEKQMLKEFDGLFDSAEINEHIRNGVNAYNLIGRRDYKIIDNKNGNGKVCVIFNGKDSSNMTMPAGQMQILEVEKGLAISKPSDNSYVSNSVFAMELFDSSIGVTGTLSESAWNNVFKEMGFSRSGNAKKTDSINAIVRNRSDMSQVVRDFKIKVLEKGVASVQLVLAPDTDYATNFAAETIYMIAKDKNISLSKEQIIKFLDTDIMSQKLEGGKTIQQEVAEWLVVSGELKEEVAIEQYGAIEEGIRLKKDKNLNKTEIANKINEIKTETIKNILGIEDGVVAKEISRLKFVNSNATDASIDLLKYEFKAGAYDYVVSDARFIGRGWDAGKMTEARDIFKEIQDYGPMEEKVLINNWLLEPTKMSESTLTQGTGRTMRGDNRFEENSYDKNIVALHSLEGLMDNNTISKAIVGKEFVNEEGKVDIIKIIDRYLPTVLEENGNAEVRSSGIMIQQSRQSKFMKSKINEDRPTVSEVFGEVENSRYNFDRNDPIILKLGLHNADKEVEEAVNAKYNELKNQLSYTEEQLRDIATKEVAKDFGINNVSGTDVEKIKEKREKDIYLTDEQWFAINNYKYLLALGYTNSDDNNDEDKVLAAISSGNLADMYDLVADNTDDEKTKEYYKKTAAKIRSIEESSKKIQDKNMATPDEQRRFAQKLENFGERFGKDKGIKGNIMGFVDTLKGLPGGAVDFISNPISNIKLFGSVIISPIWDAHISGDRKNLKDSEKELKKIKQEAFNEYITDTGEQNSNKNTEALMLTATLSVPPSGNPNAKNFGVVSFADDEIIKNFENKFIPGSETPDTWNTGILHKAATLSGIYHLLKFVPNTNIEKEFDTETYLKLVDEAERANRRLAMKGKEDMLSNIGIDVDELSTEEEKQLKETIEAPKKYLEATGHKGSELYRRLNDKDADTAVDSVDEFIEKSQVLASEDLPEEILNSRYANQARALISSAISKDELISILKENGYTYKDGSLTSDGKILLSQILFALANDDIGRAGIIEVFDSLDIKVESNADIIRGFIKLQQKGILASVKNTKAGVSAEEFFYLAQICKYKNMEDLEKKIKEYKENGINGLIDKDYVDTTKADNKKLTLELTKVRKNSLIEERNKLKQQLDEKKKQSSWWNRRGLSSLEQQIKKLEEEIIDTANAEITLQDDTNERKKLQKELDDLKTAIAKNKVYVEIESLLKETDVLTEDIAKKEKQLKELKAKKEKLTSTGSLEDQKKKLEKQKKDLEEQKKMLEQKKKDKEKDKEKELQENYRELKELKEKLKNTEKNLKQAELKEENFNKKYGITNDDQKGEEIEKIEKEKEELARSIKEKEAKIEKEIEKETNDVNKEIDKTEEEIKQKENEIKNIQDIEKIEELEKELNEIKAKKENNEKEISKTIKALEEIPDELKGIAENIESTDTKKKEAAFKKLKAFEKESETTFETQEEELTVLKTNEDGNIVFKTTTKAELNKKIVLGEGEQILEKEESTKDKVKEFAKLIEDKGYEQDLMELLADSISKDEESELNENIKNYEKKNGITKLTKDIANKTAKKNELETKKEELETSNKELNSIDSIIEKIEDVQKQLNIFNSAPLQIRATMNKEKLEDELDEYLNEFEETLSNSKYGNEIEIDKNIDKMESFKISKEKLKEKNYKKQKYNVEKNLSKVNKKLETLEEELSELSEEYKSKTDNKEYKLSKKVYNAVNKVNLLIEELEEIDVSKEGEFEKLMAKYDDIGADKLSKALPQIADILIGKLGNIGPKGSKDLVKVLSGVMKPEEYSEFIAAVLVECSTADEIAQALYFDNILEVQSKDVDADKINKQFWRKLSEIQGMNISREDIAKLVVARDILLAVNRGDISPTQLNDANLKPSQIEGCLVKNKAVNMNVILKDIKEVTEIDNDKSVTVDNNEDFVIDVEKLKQKITDKAAIKKIMNDLENKNWSVILMEGGRGSADKSIALMNISDIKAVAASA